MSQDPGDTFVSQDPGDTFMSQDPGDTFMSQDPGPGDTFMSQDPGDTFMSQDPGDTFMSQDPGDTFMSQDPGDTFMSQDPGTEALYMLPSSRVQRSHTTHPPPPSLSESPLAMECPHSWGRGEGGGVAVLRRTVQDSFTGDQAVLTDEQLDLIEKIQSSQYPVPGFDPYEISKLVHAIKMGWIKPIQKPSKPKFFMLWSDTDKDPGQRHNMHIPAPKMKLPGHEESYNPPPEYLPTETEIKAWGEMDPEDRPRNFLPKKYTVSFMFQPTPIQKDGYASLPRAGRPCYDPSMQVKVDPEELIPKIPKPRDLQPYPTTESILFKGHAGLVRCISVEPQGQWMASGSDDSTLKLWEVDTGRCVKTIPLPGKPHSLAFCPNASLTLLAIAVDASVYLINHGLGDKLLVASTDSTISGSSAPQDTDNSAGTAVVIHQISKRRSQTPFSKLKGAVQAVAFHPSKPIFFVATQTTVRVYDLAKRELVKKLMTGVKWISSIDIHPQGDNVIIGSCDKRLCWFDLDLSSKPYKILSDDGSAIVCHGMVYNDLMQNPLLVPVKVLRGHSIINGLGVLDCKFHPTQPWLFTAGVDSTIRLFT
eukprot:Em0018g713a